MSSRRQIVNRQLHSKFSDNYQAVTIFYQIRNTGFSGFYLYNQGMVATNDFVGECKTVGDPGKQEKARNWDIAIGL